MPLVFVTVCYRLIKPRHGLSSKYPEFLLVAEIQAFTGASLGYLVASLSPDAEVATLLAPIFVFPMILLGGLYANVGAIPVEARWINKVNPIYYAFQAISIAEWADYGDIGGFPKVFATGNDVLDFFSLHERSFEANLWRLGCVGLGLRSAVLLVLALAAGNPGLLPVVPEDAATANPVAAQ